MTLLDRYKNPLATSSSRARDHYVEGVDHVLGATYGACQSFQAAIMADPGFALAHAGLARAAMYENEPDLAKSAIARAAELTPGLSRRERQHIDVFALLVSGQGAKARVAVQAHVAEFPRDALCAQVCTNIFGLIGFSGEPGREAALLAYTAGLLPHYGEDWWMTSMHALSLCEVGRLDDAMSLMDRSLALNARNANGAHFKSHALYESGQTGPGRAYLSDWMAGYDRRAVLHGHLSWHEALWALEQGDASTMWQIMDSCIAPDASTSLPINVLTDSAALLYRAELAGLPVPPERWKTLSDYAARFFAGPGQSFADMHAALCHAMAGDGDRLAVFAQAQTGFAADLVRPVAKAWGAIARQDWAGALNLLTPVMADHARLGGSRAQRDLLELTFVNVLLKLGLTGEAHRAMQGRRPVFAGAAPVVGYA